MGLDDAYTAYCFDEAVYLWGSYVEGELHSAGADAKTDKEAHRKRQTAIQRLLRPGAEQDVDVSARVERKRPAAKPEDTQEDPLAAEARKMGISEATLRATVSFKNRQFKDPAPLFEGGDKKVTKGK